jgi:hypothetical protein
MRPELRGRWRELLFGVTVFSFGVSVLRAFLRPGRPPINTDAAFFQHAGWYVTQGAVPYVEMWDIKPPLTIETTSVLAVLSFGNMYVLHVLSVLLTVAAGIGTVYLVGELVYHVTDHELASLTAGLTVLTIAGFHGLPAFGFRPKYFAMVFGLLALLLTLRDRPLYAGVAAAMSAGYMQHGAIFTVLILGVLLRRRSYEGVGRALAGMAVTTVVAVLPIALLGGFSAMLVEVVLVPLTASEETGILAVLGNLQRGFLFLGYAVPVILVGLYGVVRVGILDRADDTGWIVAGTALSGVQILAIDFDGYADLFFGLLFTALGVGLVVANARDRPRTVVVGVVVAVVVVSVTVMGGVGVVSDPIDEVHTSIAEDRTDTVMLHVAESIQSLSGVEDQVTPSNTTVHPLVAESQYNQSSVVWLYWNKAEPVSCHYRLSVTELQWVEQTGRSITAERCGQFPA